MSIMNNQNSKCGCGHNKEFHLGKGGCVVLHCSCADFYPHPTTSKSEECTCACHKNVLRKPYEHDTACCNKMNGFVATRLENWEETFREKFCGSKTYSYFARNPDEIISFISTLLQEERGKTEHLSKQIDRLANWIMENMPNYIKAEGAVDTAIEIMWRYKDLLK